MSFAKFPNQFNIIPIPRNSKIPNFKWEIYQKKKYDKPLLKNNGNYAVICGHSSNNLLVIDLDLKDKKYFPEIYEKFKKTRPAIAETRLVSTPHGYHLYYFMKGFTVDRKPNKNAGYNDKNKFVGTLKTNFKHYLKGFDILGNNGYAITWNSRVDGLNYECSNGNTIKYITQEEFEQIKTFFLREKPQRARKPFLDILNGKIDIEDYASTTDAEEFEYWKALFREVYHYYGLIPQEIFKGLQANQSSFDIEKTETQLQYHPHTEKPYTNDKLKELFPEYQIGKPKFISKKGKKEPEEPDLYEICDQILHENYIKTIDFGSRADFCIYNDGYYKRKQQNKVDSIISTLLRDLDISYSLQKSVALLKLVRDNSLVSLDEFDKDPYILNLENGLLDIKTLKIKPHTPKYLSFRRLPIKYNPKAKCPKISKFIAGVIEKYHIAHFYQKLGLSLTPIMKFQKATFLFGSGNNGKTTLFNLMRYLIGNDNTSNVDLYKFDSHFFSKIENKLMNIVSDVDSSKKIKISNFKLYVGNEAVVSINPKYIQPYDVKPTAKLWYSCNERFPEVPEETDKGFWRKIDIIPCPYEYDGREDWNLLEKIASEEELSGLLNITLIGLCLLLKRKRFNKKYFHWKEIKDFWFLRLNEFQQFIEEKTKKIGLEYYTQKSQTLKQFNIWLKTKGRPPTTSNKLTKIINATPEFVYDENRKMKINGVRKRVYFGFELSNLEKDSQLKLME